MKYLFASITVLGALAVIYGAFFYDPVSSLNRYENRTLGIAFSYPQGFELSESQQGVGDESYVITLVRETDASLPEAGEGPVSVSVAVYAANGRTLHDWMREAPASNFHLGSGSYASSTVANQEAVVFAWSGLYEGETTAFMHQNHVISVSGTVLSQDDGMREAYELVRTSFELR